MLRSEDFLKYLRSLEIVLQCLAVVALGIIHSSNIVVRSGGGGMLRSEDFLLYRQSLLVVLQGLAVVALFIIHHADIVVRSGGVFMFFAIQFLCKFNLPEIDRFSIFV